MSTPIKVSEPIGKKNPESVSLPADLIRTVAIVLVIMVHASIEPYNSLVLTPFQSSMYWWTWTVYKSLALPCVPLFIMLSGALLLQPSKVNEPIRVFLKKRLSRIGLAFAFWSAIYLAWGFFLTHYTINFNTVIQGILFGIFTGPYFHFWFIYLIVGLYLITPILRVVTAYGGPKIIKYLIILWFVGVAIVPLVQLISGCSLNTSVFVIGGWVGYFVFGVYSQKVRLRRSILYGLLILGFAWTIAGAWLVTYPFQPTGQPYYFFDYLTANVIVASVALFLILSEFPSDWPGKKHPYTGLLVQAISKNTLPIYLFHVIILESLQKGFFGFKLSLTTLNPILEIPLITILTLFITTGAVILMKKVPLLRKLIG